MSRFECKHGNTCGYAACFLESDIIVSCKEFVESNHNDPPSYEELKDFLKYNGLNERKISVDIPGMKYETVRNWFSPPGSKKNQPMKPYIWWMLNMWYTGKDIFRG